MEEKRNKCIAWMKEHKAELVVAGISLGAILALILGIKNHALLEEKWTLLKKLVEKVPEEVKSVEVRTETEEVSTVVKEHFSRISHDVVGHERNLAKGQRASQKQIAAAAEYGVKLPPEKTWVNPYRTGGAVA